MFRVVGTESGVDLLVSISSGKRNEPEKGGRDGSQNPVVDGESP